MYVVCLLFYAIGGWLIFILLQILYLLLDGGCHQV